jgi:hypothetical protein
VQSEVTPKVVKVIGARGRYCRTHGVYGVRTTGLIPVSGSGAVTSSLERCLMSAVMEEVVRRLCDPGKSQRVVTKEGHRPRMACVSSLSEFLYAP